MVIPKIIHQVWLGPAPLPDTGWPQSIRAKHPDWEYRLWTDTNVAELGCDHLFPPCKTYSARANVARLYAVWRYGGMYLDMDVECFKNVEPLLSGVRAFAAYEYEPDNRLCNAIFGATQGHPWIGHQLQMLPACVYYEPPWGPTVMSAANRDDLTIVPTELFYPYLWGQAQVPTEAAYFAHHWSMTWQQAPRLAPGPAIP